MRKKFLAMYALVGALVASPIFTSCIDSEESESVTAVRKEAAEKQRILNQIDAANAELQVQLEKLKLEAGIAEQEGKLLEFQLTLKENQEKLNAYGVKTLSELTTAYTTALSNAANSEWNLATYNQRMKNLETGYTDTQAYIAEETERLNALIAANEATIEKLKKYQEEGLTPDVVNAEINELYNAYVKLNKVYTDLVLKYGEDAANTVTGKAITYLTQLSGGPVVYGRATEGEDDGEDGGEGDESTGEAPVMYYQINAEGNPVLAEAAVMDKQDALAEAIKNAQKTLDDAVAALGTEADTEETKVSKEEDAELTLYAQLAAAKKALAAAEKAVADAGEAVTEELEGNVTEAEGKVKEKEKAIAEAKDKIVSYETTLAFEKKNSEDFEAAIAAFEGEDYETYLAALAELKTAEKAKDLAYNEWDAMNKAYSEWGGINTGMGTEIEGDIYGLGFEAALQTLTSEINEYKSAIERLAPYSYNYTDIDSDEMYAAAVAHLERLIDMEEVKLATYNKQAEEAKAALDAYLGTEA